MLDFLLPVAVELGKFAATLIVLVSLFGLVIPIFPGHTVIWVTAILYAWGVGFDTQSWWMLGGFTVLFIIAATVDNLLMGGKAKLGGASWLTIGLALLSGVVFTFLFPPIGGVVAAPIVLFLLEFLRQKELALAWKATKSLMIGWGMSFVVRFVIGVIMVILWFIWLY